MIHRAALLFLIAATLHAAEPLKPLRFSVQHMDPAAAPGDDFYKHACGTWIKTHSIPPDWSSWSPSTHLMEMNLVTLRRLCETSASKPERTRVEQLVGDFFAAARDEAKLEEQKFQPIAKTLDAIAALKTKDEAASLIAQLHREGIGPFFGWYVSPDERQSNVYALHLVQGGLSLPERDYYLEKDFEKERGAFVEHVGKMFVLAGDDEAKAKAAATDLMRLETQLAKVSKPAQDLNDSEANYHKLTRDGLERASPEFPWALWWQGVGVQAADCIVGQPEFLTAMAKLFNEEPLPMIQIYLR